MRLAKCKEGAHGCLAHCEVSPYYDGHHTTVWEEHPPAEVKSLDCSCPTYEKAQLGSVDVAQVCPELLKVEEWDTMSTDYWGRAMDVAATLDKVC